MRAAEIRLGLLRCKKFDLSASYKKHLLSSVANDIPGSIVARQGLEQQYLSIVNSSLDDVSQKLKAEDMTIIDPNNKDQFNSLTYFSPAYRMAMKYPELTSSKLVLLQRRVDRYEDPKPLSFFVHRRMDLLFWLFVALPPFVEDRVFNIIIPPILGGILIGHIELFGVNPGFAFIIPAALVLYVAYMWLFPSKKRYMKRKKRNDNEVLFEDVEMINVVVEAKVEARKAGEYVLVVNEGTELSLDGRIVETKMEEFEKGKLSIIQKDTLL